MKWGPRPQRAVPAYVAATPIERAGHILAGMTRRCYAYCWAWRYRSA
jgi:hypothetical protein